MRFSGCFGGTSADNCRLAMSAGTVLVVDDDAAIRETVNDVLTDEGYNVVLAENGEEALEQLKRRNPAVVLLDLMMPVMSGWEVLEALDEREDLAHIPIVVVSAMCARQVPGSTEEPPRPPNPPGARMYLPKPIDLNHLLNVVAHYCGMMPS
jgi:two-component system response regulator CpxR